MLGHCIMEKIIWAKCNVLNAIRLGNANGHCSWTMQIQLMHYTFLSNGEGVDQGCRFYVKGQDSASNLGASFGPMQQQAFALSWVSVSHDSCIHALLLSNDFISSLTSAICLR
jgi:hypothetical protein